MYKIQCECGKQLSVAFGQVNLQGRCPSCARTFIIPAPTELTTGKLKCRCGLVMEYDYQDAGSLCECSQCNALFKIPGGTAESLSSQLDRELNAKKVQATTSITQAELPQNPVFESLGEFHQSTKPKPVVRADYESFGFGKLLAGVTILFVACVSLGVVAMWAQGMLKLPNNWVPKERSAKEQPSEESPDLAEAASKEPGANDAANSQPEKLPNPFDRVENIRWVRIGAMPPSVSPPVPESIGKPFAPTSVTDSEAAQLAVKIVAAVNNNSSKDLTALMDAEVLGDYLFQHAKIPAEKRFQLGSEALELYSNHTRLLEQMPDAQVFPSIRMGGSMVPLIRVSSNAYQGPQSLDPLFGPGQTVSGVPTNATSNSNRASDELIKEYDRIRMDIHNQLPVRFRRTRTDERWKDLQFQRTPLNTLLDHAALYFAVITTRNREGRPVLLDLACVNQDLCLLETTWNSIDENTEKKSFDCSRPPNQTEKYLRAFREAVGDKTMNDIFKANYAFKQVRLPKFQVSVVTGFLEESKIPQPSPDDCLDALEDLERLFPNDRHNVMLQYITSREAKFTKEANQLFDKLVKLKYSNVSFYDEVIGRYRWIDDVEMAKKIVDALKANCL